LQLKESEGRLSSPNFACAQEKERRVLAAELHDSFASDLAAIKWSLERKLLAGKKRGERDLQEEVWLEDVITKVQKTISDIRGIMTNLRPSTLDDLGILATISGFTREFEKTYGHIRVESRIGIKEEEVPDGLKTVIFRVLQEATNNIARHSGADLVSIALLKKVDKLQFSVRDNGHGFDVQEKLSANQKNRSLGLDSMRERVEISGGNFTIESTPGKGTIIQAEWPAITSA
jgi:signal transduction histidine kinase